ncbi:class I SAM-dependent methyltransferase [Phycicoccus duodecadis]|uniref:Methyltransferase family protein n=1 Tax=Phycicoccus duodecadis TaxID=173053 RepID=A0A2N3YFA8_9MICO|nr:class I SAM-dependent methyltransferase [Phycicoccus duodecadis]PKW25538.1 methyltransferase family protein [Phycicoccus duodecadis]
MEPSDGPDEARAEVRAAYDAIAQDYAATYPGTEPEARLDLAMVEDFADRVLEGGGARVLDAGCGTGRMARFLADRGCSVVGVDISPGMLAMARRHHPDLEVHEASLTDLPFADASFDGVLLWYSVIHLPDEDLARALAEVARVVRPGGHVLVASQKGDGPVDVGARLRERGHDVVLTRYHRGPRDLMSALAAVGLERRARMIREAVGREQEGQVVVLARRA